MSVEKEIRIKTYKREVAGILLACGVLLGAYAAVAESDAAVKVLETVWFGIVLFATGAFGLDEVTKNMGARK